MPLFCLHTLLALTTILTLTYAIQATNVQQRR
jgi:hypothetical protein